MKKIQLLLSVLVVFVMFATSCTPASPAAPTEAPAQPQQQEKEEAPAPGGAIEQKQDEPAPTAPPVSQYKEAPMLAEMVAAGTLPPVEERLPVNPLVTTPVESIGQYGGTLHTASWWPEVGNVKLYFAVEAPIKWKADLTGYEPALAESYEWSDDGMTFTIHLREGLKWSDGTPYTSADWEFMWEDILKNEDYKVHSVPGWLRKSDGTPIDMEFPDDYTIVWKSDRPMWINPYYMAQGSWEFADPMMKPAHFLKQYHPKYTEGATYEDLEKMDQWEWTPGYPCLFAWCTKEVSADGTRYTFSRNPYYWRVDTEGNQLPYIDELEVEIVTDEQVRILNCASGKYDTGFRICGSPNDIPFLQEQSATGDYKLLEGWMNGAGAWPGYMVNQWYVEGGKNYENDTPEKAAEIREILRSKDFRVALSIGLDRNRMIDVVWGGIGDPKNYTISPQSWHFASPEGQEVYQRWASNAAEFDPDRANELLDALGMEVGPDGFRTLPSGEPFELVIDVTDWGGSLKVQTDAAAEAEVQWENNLKINVRVNNIQGQPDVDTRTNEGQFMLRAAHISEIDIWTYPDWVFPIVNRYYFPLEGRYWAKGKDTCVPDPNIPNDCGVKPLPGSPAEKLQALYEQGLSEGDIQKRHEIVWEAMQVHIDEGPFVIGVAGDQAMPIIVKNHMRNILDFGVVGPWAPATPGNQIAAQWWIEQ